MLKQRSSSGRRVSAVTFSHFDTFLCHNTDDKAAVRKIGLLLIQNNLRPWLDEWEIPPGVPWQRVLEDQIRRIQSAVVFVGRSGIGPWQRIELDSFLREFVGRGCPVIPVILPSAQKLPKLPIFLQGMKWIDFRKNVPNPMELLIWGITGRRSKPNKCKDKSQIKRVKRAG